MPDLGTQCRIGIRAGNLQIATENRCGAFVVVDGGIQFAKHLEHFEALRRLRPGRGHQLRGAAFEHLFGGQLALAMFVAGFAEHQHHIVAHGVGTRRFGARDVALARSLACLPCRAGESRREHSDQRQHGCHCPAIASQEVKHEVGSGASARGDRFCTQVTAHVRMEAGHGGIAFARLLAQRLGDDRIQIAGQLPGRHRCGCLCRSDNGRCGCSLVQQFFDRDGDRPLPDRPGQARSEQFEQQHAERIDIGRGRHGVAGQLFRGCVRQRHRRVAGRFVGVVGEQLGDAEVEQFDVTIVADDDVTRLQVAMNDQILVRVCDRIASLQKQVEPFVQAGTALPAPFGDRHALDQFHDHVRTTIVGNACIVQARNPGMFKAGQDAAFGDETTEVFDCIGTQQFQCDLLFELTVGTLGAVDLAHATPAQQRQHAIGADAMAGLQFDCRRATRDCVQRRSIQQVAACFKFGQQRQRLLAQTRLVGGLTFDECDARVRWLHQDAIQQRVQLRPFFRDRVLGHCSLRRGSDGHGL